MNIISVLSSQLWTARLSATLLHFVWQGLAVGLLYAIARKIARPSAGPNTLYVMACGALLLIAVTPVITWLMLAPSPSAVIAETFKLPLSAAHSRGPRDASGFQTEFQMQSWVVASWLVGALMFLIRMLGGWFVTERLRSQAVIHASEQLQKVLVRLKVRIAVARPVVLKLSAALSTPAIAGWLRPILLMPAGVLAGLPADQIEALLLHELAHVRRRDYLVNVLQSVVESLLFYHPVVWWISRDIRTERERCCDDLVVRATGDAVTYARALAALESFRQSYASVAVAASGGSLANRISRLAGIPETDRYSVSGTGIAVVATILVLFPFTLLGQLTPRPKFEVASIKPVTGARTLMGVQPQPGRLTASASLQMLMENAYGVHAYQIVGGPTWIDSDRFQIEAKADGNATRDQIFQMLQSLLEERYQLKIHREERELPVFALTPANGGIKLPAPKDGGCIEPSANTPPDWSGSRMLTPQEERGTALNCGSVRISLTMNGAQLQGSKVAMAELTRMLSLAMDRTVLDKTGLTRLFDVLLTFTPDDTTTAMPPPPPGFIPTDQQAPPIIVALREQLGLKLESTRGPVEVIVIDHVERPTTDGY